MSNYKIPKFSFILIARKASECEAALTALGNLLAGPEDIEILVATGCNPSAQRNRAALEAKGDYLIFLDNDSIVDSRLLHYYQDALSYDSGIGIVGGPSVFEGQAQGFKAAVQAVFCSVFGLGPFRSRYMSLGSVQEATEEKLILCNILIRRELFLNARGFNTNLYPNEENEFLNRVKNHTKIYYHPLAVCYREPRNTFKDFCKQMLSYGEGRARHMAMFPKFWNSIFLIPLIFSVYIVSLPAIFLLAQGLPLLIFTIPLQIYLFFNFSASVFALLSWRSFKLLVLLPFMFLTCHFCYGVGLLLGFLKYPFSAERAIGDIKVMKLKAFGEQTSAVRTA